MNDDEKDYGPAIAAQIMGISVGSYIEHNVSKAEVLELVGEMYDGITKVIRKEVADPAELAHLADRTAFGPYISAVPDDVDKDEAAALEYSGRARWWRGRWENAKLGHANANAHIRAIEKKWIAEQPLQLADIDQLCTAITDGEYLCCKIGRPVLERIFGDRVIWIDIIGEWAYEDLGHEAPPPARPVLEHDRDTIKYWATAKGRAEAIGKVQRRWLPVARGGDPSVS